MKELYVTVISILAAFLFVGCTISKPYVMETDRKDQDLEEGNRGYLKGTPPPAPDRTNLKRPFLAVDIDIPPGIEEGTDESATTQVKETTTEATVVKEETPTTVKEKVTVTEESIK